MSDGDTKATASTTKHVDVHAGEYFDSVRLMQVTAAVRAVEGVRAALVAMATDLNRTLLADMGFDVPVVGAGDGDVASGGVVAGSNDLVVAIEADDEAACERGRQVYLQELRTAGGAGAAAGAGTATAATAATAAATDGTSERARTVGSAARRRMQASDATGTVALISVPGPHAFAEAMDALAHGMHVMVFSDNVTVEHEIALKREGQRRGLLVMGPDCGTAIIAGLGLGFANALEPGSVSLVGASGTGIQQICCLLDIAGVGVRHALGTGGRDLSAEVGGAGTLAALEALDADPSTALIALVSKPPAAEVGETVRTLAGKLSTPVVTAFVGHGAADTDAGTLEAATERILRALGQEPPNWPQAIVQHAEPRGHLLRGIFCGGTLCAEARAIAASVLGPVAGDESASGHSCVDYGDDAYTRGRAHPMIDQSVRLERLKRAQADADVGVVLLDVVLGYGAHPDPTAELAPAIAAACADGVAVVVSLCGSLGDTQERAAAAFDRHTEAPAS